MKRFLINVLAVAGGLVVGSCVNMGLILLGPAIVPPPPGADLTTPCGRSPVAGEVFPRMNRRDAVATDHLVGATIATTA